eukprot:303604-Pleurochrysis_carterae.AAC.1
MRASAERPGRDHTHCRSVRRSRAPSRRGWAKGPARNVSSGKSITICLWFALSGIRDPRLNFCMKFKQKSLPSALARLASATPL